MKVLALLVILVVAVSCEEDQNEAEDATIVLTDENFKEVIKENSSFFVMFFAPW